MNLKPQIITPSSPIFFYRDLVSNPFICNCHLAWFSEWLRKRDLTAASPKCAGPDAVRDVPIHELPQHEFKCLSKCSLFDQI